MTRRNMNWNRIWDLEILEETTPANRAQVERPAPVVERLRTAKPRKKRVRDRSWEKAHPKKSFRKVPNEIRDAVKEIAVTLDFSIDHVAQAFLEYALMCYRRGDFSLDLELDPRYGLTLIPGGWSNERKPVWAENLSGTKTPPPTRKRRPRQSSPLWKQRVHYRLSPELLDAIDNVCGVRRTTDGELVGRKYHDGEVVARFLAFAIQAYRAGKLVLRDPSDE